MAYHEPMPACVCMVHQRVSLLFHQRNMMLSCVPRYVARIKRFTLFCASNGLEYLFPLHLLYVVHHYQLLPDKSSKSLTFVGNFWLWKLGDLPYRYCLGLLVLWFETQCGKTIGCNFLQVKGLFSWTNRTKLRMAVKVPLRDHWER